LIHQRLDDRRLFTVGIGSAPNSFFMRKAAAAGKGTFTYVGSVQEVGTVMKDLFEKIKSPVMQNIEVSFKGTKGEIWPRPLPDLYTGGPVVILARLTDADGSLVVTGEYGGLSWSKEVSLSKAKKGVGIGTLWARKKIDALLDQSIEGVAEDEIRAKVLPLALEFGIVSPYTSFVAVEHVISRPASENLESGKAPLNNPAGWQPPESVNQLAGTATLGGMFLMVGCLLLAFPLGAFIVLRLTGRRSSGRLPQGGVG
jgi:Ca-activated chloride channel family protein